MVSDWSVNCKYQNIASMAYGLEEEQVGNAVKALFAYLKKRDASDKSNQLFDDDAFVTLVLSLKKVPEVARVKPFQIPLQHSLYQDKSICLFTKDPHQPIKQHLEENPIEGIDKVMGVMKLRKNYRQYEDKRKLLQTYDLFLADERILPLLPACLGKKFFDKKRQPAPVNLTRNLTTALEGARDSTYFFLNAGPTCMVKIGRTGFAKQQVVENVMSSINAIVDRIPKKWKNIQAIFIRTHDSVALPVYNALPSGTVKADEKEEKQDKPKPTKKRSLAEVGSVGAAIAQYKMDEGKKVKKYIETKPFTSIKIAKVSNGSVKEHVNAKESTKKAKQSNKSPQLAPVTASVTAPVSAKKSSKKSPQLAPASAKKQSPKLEPTPAKKSPQVGPVATPKAKSSTKKMAPATVKVKTAGKSMAKKGAQSAKKPKK